MPIIGYRPAPPFVLPNLGNGSAMTTAAMNGFEDLKTHLAERGSYAHSETACNVNGKVRPIVGVVGGLGGGTYAFEHGKISTSWPVHVSAGYDTITYFLSCRLQQTVTTPADGCMIRIDLVLNGVAKRVATPRWSDDDIYNNFGPHYGYRVGNFKIGNLFNLPIEQPATMYLVATFQTCENEATFGTPSPTGSFTNDQFWNGLEYFGFAAYRDCLPC